MVDYIGVSDVARLIHSIGPGQFIERLAAEMEADYRRWSEFEKSARLASHSAVGVIELMPTSDGHYYSFKYVNGHPKNTAEGLLTVTAFGVLADVTTGYPLLLSELTVRGVIVTARSETGDFDFVSRFFAPGSGVNEDPVTGSAHCCLGPFWAKRLGKTEFVAYQASPRGGVVRVRLQGDRVILGGQAVTVMRGELLD